MAAGQGQEYQGWPHEILGRDSTLVRNRNMKEIKIFSTQNSSLIGPVVWSEDLFLARNPLIQLHPLQPDSGQSLRCKCFVWSSLAVEWKIVIIIAKKLLTIIYKSLRDLWERDIGLFCDDKTRERISQVGFIQYQPHPAAGLLFPSPYTGDWILWTVDYCEVLWSIVCFIVCFRTGWSSNLLS